METWSLQVSLPVSYRFSHHRPSAITFKTIAMIQLELFDDDDRQATDEEVEIFFREMEELFNQPEDAA